MKIYVLLLFSFSIALSGYSQLKNQTIILKSIPVDHSNFKNLNEIKVDKKANSSDKKTLISPGLITTATTIGVNTVAKIIKKRISNKTIEYSTSFSDENFYFIKNDSIVYQGLRAFQLKRKNKKFKTELSLEIVPVFSKNKLFFKWRIENLEVEKGGFKRKSKNIDIELKIGFKYFSKVNLIYGNSSLPEQKITVYSAQKKDNGRIFESEWMPIPSFGEKAENPLYTIYVAVKEMTAVAEIYTEVIAQENSLKKSLTDFINKLINDSPPEK